jgi:hypothetical protein
MLIVIAHAAHVVGAFLFFVGLGIELVVLRLFRAATTPEQALQALKAFSLNQLVGPLGMLLLLVPGLYLAATVWHFQPTWIHLGIALLVAVAVVGGAVSGRIVSRLQKDGAAALAAKDDAALVVSFAVRAALLVAAVVIMATKPALGASLVVVAVGVVVSVAGALVSRR